jgi:hypothetical protein
MDASWSTTRPNWPSSPLWMQMLCIGWWSVCGSSTLNLPTADPALRRGYLPPPDLAAELQLHPDLGIHHPHLLGWHPHQSTLQRRWNIFQQQRQKRTIFQQLVIVERPPTPPPPFPLEFEPIALLDEPLVEFLKSPSPEITTSPRASASQMIPGSPPTTS